ncbi:MAG TPA: ABC transporter permease [Streptosporangiaceae bacterium]|jgi:peptide/nickel transport system permease protein|nr:ABC transporter permease [Streptosporangiaceae bacterium]
MVAFVLRRLAIAVPVILGILLIAFCFVHLLPGSPIQMLINPNDLSGPDSAKYLASLRAELGLNKPLPIQWLDWMGQLLKGNLGYSYQQQVPVTSLIGQRIGATVLLSVTALLLALAIAIPLGVVAALKQRSGFDYASVGISMFAISIPIFFLGLMAIYVFSLRLGWLPPGGISTLGVTGSFSDTVRHLALPACVLSAVLLGPYVRYVRQSMLEVLGMDYIRTAIAKGAPRRRVVFRHALRNALIPLTTVLAIQIPALLAGTLVIETVFAWPGLGLLVYDAISNRDYPIILAVVMLSAALVVLFNLIADVVAAVLDPRIRL